MADPLMSVCIEHPERNVYCNDAYIVDSLNNSLEKEISKGSLTHSRRSDSGISLSTLGTVNDHAALSRTTSISTTRPSTRTSSVSSVNVRNNYRREICVLPPNKLTPESDPVQNLVFRTIDSEIVLNLEKCSEEPMTLENHREKLIERRFINSSGALHLNISRQKLDPKHLPDPSESDGEDYMTLTPCDEEVINHFDKEFATTPKFKRPPKPDFDWHVIESKTNNHQKQNELSDVKFTDLFTGSFLTFLTLTTNLVLLVLVSVLYAIRKEYYFVLNSLLFLHLPCVAFLLQRIRYALFESTEPSYFVRVLSSIWYIITAPFMELLPFLRLLSAVFDKILMITGDPNDTRDLIRRQESIAFNDLVWFCILGAFPQAVFQLYSFHRFISQPTDEHSALLFFAQLGTVCSSLLLCSFLIGLYDKYGHHHHSEQAESSQKELPHLLTRSFVENCFFTGGWTLYFIARCIALTAALFLIPYPILVIGTIWIVHTTTVIVSSCIISFARKRTGTETNAVTAHEASETSLKHCYTRKTFLDDIRLGFISSVFILNYSPLKHRELDKLAASAVLLAAHFAENTCVFALTFLPASKGLLSLDVLMTVFGIHYVCIAGGIFLLIICFRIRSSRQIS